MSPSNNKVVLGYWKIRGLGQPIRLLLRYLGVDFEDKYYDFTPELTKDYWYADREKLNLDFPNLPYLIDGSTKVTESRAIMKYICRTRKPELLGKTVDVQTNIDMVDDFMYDWLYSNFTKVLYQYTEEIHNAYKEVEPVKLGYLSKFLGNNPWITGKDITYVDFLTYEYLDHMRVYDSKCLDRFQNIKDFMKRFEELPAIKAYMVSPEFLKTPCYTKLAIIQI